MQTEKITGYSELQHQIPYLKRQFIGKFNNISQAQPTTFMAIKVVDYFCITYIFSKEYQIVKPVILPLK